MKDPTHRYQSSIAGERQIDTRNRFRNIQCTKKVVVAAAVKTVDNMTSSSHMFYFLNSVIKKLNIY